jgi:hypothetical protein
MRSWIPLTFSLVAVGCGNAPIDDTDGEIQGHRKQAGYLCPAGARFATNGEDRMFCLFENLPFPEAHDVKAYCDYLDRGYIGYHWPLCEDPSDSPCSANARYATNQQELGFCLFDVGKPPANASSYCHYLDDGYIGFMWSLCPPGATFQTNKDGLHFCVFENLKLPPHTEVTAECEHLREGYIGFSFPMCQSLADYTCPDGFSFWTDGKGTGKCFRKDLSIPAELDVGEYCWWLHAGYFGFLWQDPR